MDGSEYCRGAKSAKREPLPRSRTPAVRRRPRPRQGDAGTADAGAGSGGGRRPPARRAIRRRGASAWVLGEPRVWVLGWVRGRVRSGAGRGVARFRTEGWGYGLRVCFRSPGMPERRPARARSGSHTRPRRIRRVPDRPRRRPSRRSCTGRRSPAAAGFGPAGTSAAAKGSWRRDSGEIRDSGNPLGFGGGNDRGSGARRPVGVGERRFGQMQTQVIAPQPKLPSAWTRQVWKQRISPSPAKAGSGVARTKAPARGAATLRGRRGCRGCSSGVVRQVLFVRCRSSGGLLLMK